MELSQWRGDKGATELARERGSGRGDHQRRVVHEARRRCAKEIRKAMWVNSVGGGWKRACKSWRRLGRGEDCKSPRGG